MNSCPVCSGVCLRVIYAATGLVRCATCSHVFVQHRTDIRNQHFEGQTYRRWRQQNQGLLRKKAINRIGFLDPYLVGSTGRVFELGCGTGETLAALHARGWAAYGVDISALSVEICREIYPEIKVGLDFNSEVLSDVAGDGYDLVMGFHVVEHVPDLKELSVRLAECCRPGGLLCLFVPNWDSWSRRLLGADWPGIMPEHVHQFTEASMRRWLSDAGFRVEQLETKGTAWHWLGGLKRKIFQSQVRCVKEEKSGMPSRRAMGLLEIADVVLQPLLWLEGWCAAGAEMRILARRDFPSS